MPKSLNISSNGDPGGNSKGKGLTFVTTVCVVDIFTTEGINLSAKSANEAGVSFALVKKEKFTNINVVIKILIFFMLILYKPDY